MTEPTPDQVAREIVQVVTRDAWTYLCVGDVVFSGEPFPDNVEILAAHVRKHFSAALRRAEERGFERAAEKCARIAGGTRSTAQSRVWYEAARTIRSLRAPGRGEGT